MAGSFPSFVLFFSLIRAQHKAGSKALHPDCTTVTWPYPVSGLPAPLLAWGGGTSQLTHPSPPRCEEQGGSYIAKLLQGKRKDA